MLVLKQKPRRRGIEQHEHPGSDPLMSRSANPFKGHKQHQKDGHAKIHDDFSNRFALYWG